MLRAHMRIAVTPAARESAPLWARPSALLAFAAVLLHLFANGQYGIFRDELYFIVCGQRPDWGYVDQPAVIPLLASWAHALFGNSLLGFRLLPMLVMSATVALTAEFAAMIGGGRFAQTLSGLCVLLAPDFLLQGVLFDTDLFQALTWLGISWSLVRLEQSGDERWWLILGAIAGFSLNTKYLIAFYLAALALGLLATPQRRSLTRPYVYLGAVLASALIAPNLLWQHSHGWPFLELGQAAAGGKNIELSPLAYLSQQLVLIGPWSAPVWLMGLWACLTGPQPRVARAFAIAWLALLLAFDLSHGKAYYLCGIYPTLLAFGATRIERRLRPMAARTAALLAITLLGVLAAPLALPILPLGTFIRYQHAVGFMPSVGERQLLGELPQYYADMFGWQQMAAQVASIYHSLPAQDRERAVFFGNNYGEAAAIDVFGRSLGLPPAISGHNNYYLWGPQEHDGSVIIIIGGSPQHYTELFDSYEVAGRITTPYAMPYETDQPIYVLHGMKLPLPQYWPQTKNYR